MNKANPTNQLSNESIVKTRINAKRQHGVPHAQNTAVSHRTANSAEQEALLRQHFHEVVEPFVECAKESRCRYAAVLEKQLARVLYQSCKEKAWWSSTEHNLNSFIDITE